MVIQKAPIDVEKLKGNTKLTQVADVCSSDSVEGALHIETGEWYEGL